MYFVNPNLAQNILYTVPDSDFVLFLHIDYSKASNGKGQIIHQMLHTLISQTSIFNLETKFPVSTFPTLSS